MVSGDIFSDLSLDVLTPSSSVREQRQTPPGEAPAKARKRSHSGEKNSGKDLPLGAEEVEHKIDSLA
jgi:hypothetical protein